MSDLRKKLIRLAYTRPEFRKDLLPLLSKEAMEHPSEKAKQQYLKKHPDADPRNHTIRESPQEKAIMEEQKQLLNRVKQEWGTMDKKEKENFKSRLEGKPEKHNTVEKENRDLLNQAKNKLKGLKGKEKEEFLKKLFGK